MRTPATSVSKARSYAPAKCDTSVEVPPMSKPMSREKPAARPVSAMPTTPAAGPDRIASLPRNNSAAVRPPEDIMNMRRVFSPPPCGEGSGVGVERCRVCEDWRVDARPLSRVASRPPTPTLPHKGGGIEIARDLRHVAAQDRREIAVDHRGVAAADKLDQRRDFVAGGDLLEAELARQRGDVLFVVAVAVGVHQHDGDGVDAVLLGALQARSRTASRSSARSTVPSARTRSSTSTTRSYSMSGLMMCLAKIFGRAW